MSEMRRRFSESAATSHPRAPLYAALSAGIAADPTLAGLLLHAPEPQRLPVLLFATTHALLLAEPDHPLAAWYPNLTVEHRSPDDPALMPTFAAFVEERRAAVIDAMTSRSTQTNEVGRCLMLLPAFGAIEQDSGPLAHLDVGCSGGLTLLSDRFQYRYEPDDGRPTTTIGMPSPVVLTAKTRGDGLLPATVPTISARCGIDLHPIDVTDVGAATWLEACVWPDQRDRFLRLRSAIEIARDRPPELLAGDAVESVGPALKRMVDRGHPVVTNSWSLNYLGADDRVRYVEALDTFGAENDLSWVYLEAPEMTPELPWQLPDTPPNGQLTTINLARWRSGTRSVEYLGTAHPHGFWIHFA